MIRHPPFSFGTTPRPEQRRFGSGEMEKGSAMRPAAHSLVSASEIICGCSRAEGKWCAVCANCRPL